MTHNVPFLNVSLFGSIVGMCMLPMSEQDRAFWMQAVHADVLN